jgi:hypothetical protein
MSPMEQDVYLQEKLEESFKKDAENWATITLFGLLIILSVGFELWQHDIYHRFQKEKTTLNVLDALFKELTILG